MADFKKAARCYTATAVLLLNTLVMFVILNLLLWAAMSAWHGVAKDNNPLSQVYPAESLRKVYPSLSDAEREDLLHETWDRPLIYDQFVEFKERPFHGRYVNVSEQGFRIGPQQGPWPIDPKNYNIFVLGGSTTFGYGVADDQTIPAYLQELLTKSVSGKQACVYNFGCGYYYSTQERILFERLLQSGAKPDVALFIDGLNDFYEADDVLPYTAQLKAAMSAADLQGNLGSRAARMGTDVMEILRLLPIGRATAFLAHKVAAPSENQQASDAVLSQVIQRYVWNKKSIESIGKANGVPTFFVFQPVPMYKYDLKYHLFNANNWYQHKNSFAGYPLMATYVAEHPMGDDFLWLADIQEGVQKPLYCDGVHYTAEFAHEIAEHIDRFVESKR